MRGDDDELCGLYLGTVWVELPWSAGHVWTRSKALQHRGSRSSPAFGARAWCQGQIYEISIDGDDWTVRYYGVPFKDDGPSHNPAGGRNPNVPANLEYYAFGQGSKVVHREQLGHLARDKNGDPIGGRLEPEGLWIGNLQGQRVLTVGFAVGTIGDTYMQVYAKPI